jgi:hypothetical protein
MADVRTVCVWCAGATSNPRPTRVKVRDRESGEESSARLCIRCIGPESTFWRRRESIDPMAVVRALTRAA